MNNNKVRIFAINMSYLLLTTEVDYVLQALCFLVVRASVCPSIQDSR